MGLTALQVQKLTGKAKPYKLGDALGLYVQVMPNDACYWRMKFRVGGKEKTLAIGVFRGPDGVVDMPLAEARRRRDAARLELRDGLDPSLQKQARKREERLAQDNTFRAVAELWLAKVRGETDPGHVLQVEASLKNNVYGEIGNRPIASIEPPDLVALLEKIERRGAHSIRAKVQQRIGAILRFGITRGFCQRDHSRDLIGSFTKPKVQNHKHLGDADLPKFLEALDSYDGAPQTRLAIRLLMLTVVRTGELRGGRWDEIDVGKRTWLIPAARMKMDTPHVVPLSRQALEALKELRALTGNSEFLFPHRDGKPGLTMSENTVLFALYRMGYHGRSTGHGMRGTFSTIMHGQKGIDPVWIERCLAHQPRDKVAGAYNHHQYIHERAGLLQRWADLLDQYAGKNVVKIKNAAR